MALQWRRPPHKGRITSGERERLAQLAYWLDEQFRIPGTRWRAGVDGIVGLIPGIGDAITTTLSAYIVLKAQRLGVPKAILRRMIWNILVDATVGSLPLLGDLFDMHWKANRKNIFLLNEYLAQHREKDTNSSVITGGQFGKTAQTPDEIRWQEKEPFIE